MKQQTLTPDQIKINDLLKLESSSPTIFNSAQCDEKTIWQLSSGAFHRDFGPAYISKTSQIWYRNGEKHRDNGPAIERTDGSLQWFKNGKLHREDGPAIIKTNSRQKSYGIYYINGIQLSERGFRKWKTTGKLKPKFEFKDFIIKTMKIIIIFKRED